MKSGAERKTLRKRRILAPVLAVVLLVPVLLSGCFLYGETSKKLTTFDSESPVIAARFFTRGGDDCSCDELELSRIPELVKTLDAMTLKTHFGHTDYYWAGQYGIELTYADGTFLVYDGVKLYHRRVSVRENFDREADLYTEYVEVTNGSFFRQLEDFFPRIKEMFGV